MFLRRLFRDLFVQKGYSWDYMFDWTLVKARQRAAAVGPRAALKGAEPVVPTESPESGEELITTKVGGASGGADGASGQVRVWGRKASQFFARGRATAAAQ